MVENIINKAKEAVSSVTEKVINFKDNFIGEEQEEINDEFKEAGSGKVKEVIDSINDSMGLITSAGYEFRGIGVALGINPSITLTFHYLRTVTDEERADLMEQAKDKKMVKLILKLLFKAGDFYKSIKMGDYGLDGVIISLGLAPGMSISFKKI
jgi:hypothetical protein